MATKLKNGNKSIDIAKVFEQQDFSSFSFTSIKQNEIKSTKITYSFTQEGCTQHEKQQINHIERQDLAGQSISNGKTNPTITR